MSGHLPQLAPIAEMCDLGFSYLLRVTNGLAYVATRRAPVLLDGTTQLTILDVNSPDRPQRLASLTVPRLRCFTVHDQYAYAGSRGGIHVIDLTDVRQPVVVGFIPFSRAHVAEYAYRIELLGDLAVVAAGHEGMLVLDLAEPSEPKLLSTYLPPSRTDVAGGRTRVYPGWVDNLALGSEHIYVYTLDGAVHVLEMADPAQPQEVAHQVIGLPQTMEYHGGCLYIATRRRVAEPGPWDENEPGPCYVVDVSTPSEPQLVSRFDPLDFRTDIIFIGNTAFAVGGTPRESGLQAVSKSFFVREHLACMGRVGCMPSEPSWGVSTFGLAGHRGWQCFVSLRR